VHSLAPAGMSLIVRLATAIKKDNKNRTSIIPIIPISNLSEIISVLTVLSRELSKLIVPQNLYSVMQKK